MNIMASDKLSEELLKANKVAREACASIRTTRRSGRCFEDHSYAIESSSLCLLRSCCRFSSQRKMYQMPKVTSINGRLMARYTCKAWIWKTSDELPLCSSQ